MSEGTGVHGAGVAKTTPKSKRGRAGSPIARAGLERPLRSLRRSLRTLGRLRATPLHRPPGAQTERASKVPRYLLVGCRSSASLVPAVKFGKHTLRTRLGTRSNATSNARTTERRRSRSRGKSANAGLQMVPLVWDPRQKPVTFVPGDAQDVSRMPTLGGWPEHRFWSWGRSGRSNSRAGTTERRPIASLQARFRAKFCTDKFRAGHGRPPTSTSF